MPAESTRLLSPRSQRPRLAVGLPIFQSTRHRESPCQKGMNWPWRRPLRRPDRHPLYSQPQGYYECSAAVYEVVRLTLWRSPASGRRRRPIVRCNALLDGLPATGRAGLPIRGSTLCRRSESLLKAPITHRTFDLECDLDMAVAGSINPAGESFVSIRGHLKWHGPGVWPTHLEEAKAAIRVGDVNVRIIGVRLHTRTTYRRPRHIDYSSVDREHPVASCESRDTGYCQSYASHQFFLGSVQRFAVKLRAAVCGRPTASTAC
jgi:hypothetical protein